MQDQIRILKKDLKEANEHIATHKAAAPPAAAMATIPAPATAAAAATQAPPNAPARHLYHDYGEEMNFHRPCRRQLDRRPLRCFLCGEEGHFVASCPARPVLQRLLRSTGACQRPHSTSRTYYGAASHRGRLPSWL